MSKDIRWYLTWFYIFALFLAVGWGITVALIYTIGLSGLIYVLSIYYESQRVGIPMSFVEKVQSRLNLSFVKVSVKKSKPKTIIGGFVIPIFPSFINIRYKDQAMKLEAIIHELCHIHYFIYGFQIAAFLLVVQIGILAPLIKWPLFVSFLLFQEFLAFRFAHKIGAELGVETRKFSKNILIKYIFVYSAVVSAMWISFYVLPVPFLISALIFYAMVRLLDKGFWYLFQAIDRGKNG